MGSVSHFLPKSMTLSSMIEWRNELATQRDALLQQHPPGKELATQRDGQELV